MPLSGSLVDCLRRAASALGLSLLVVSATACTSAEEDICAAKEECNYWSPYEYDSCVYDLEGDLSRAEFYGDYCLDLYDQWIDCQLDTGYCAYPGNYDDACGPIRGAFHDCIKR